MGFENYQLTQAQKEEFDRRYNDYLNGIGETYTWEETAAMARQALANRKANPVKLTETQIQMLQMSAEDIKTSRLISHEQANKDDLEWLKTTKI
jgi:hypothetical protein